MAVLLVLVVALFLTLALFFTLRVLSWLAVLLPFGFTVLLTLLPIDVRSELWLSSFAALDSKTFFVGSGLDAYASLGLTYLNPHNIYFLFLHEFGVFSVVALGAVFLGYCSMLSAEQHRRTVSSTNLIFSRALFCCFIFCLAVNSDLLVREYWAAIIGFILPLKLLLDTRDV